MNGMKEARPHRMNGGVGIGNQNPAAVAASSNAISVNTTSIIRVLVGIALFLLISHISFQLTSYFTGHASIHGLVRLFNLDAEDNIPSVYSTTLLLLSSLLLTIITIFKWNETRAMITHWAVLAIGFFLMAADEELSFHEELIDPVRAILGNAHLGIFYFAWVVPAIMLVAVLGLFFLIFLIRLPRKTALRFVLVGSLYVGGSIGMELIGGLYDELHGQHNLTYIAIATAEESFEMFGVILFIWALLDYMTETFGEVQIKLIPKLNKRNE